MAADGVPGRTDATQVSVSYRQYVDENDLPLITGLIDTELSEPYSIFTYRYFINNWKSLCWLAHVGDKCVGSVVCKLDMHGEMKRGYIAMLVVEKAYRKYKIGTELVQRSLQIMAQEGADEVVLEAETTNAGALRLYHNLGFIRDKRLNRYYLSGVDAYRLKLLLAPTTSPPAPEAGGEDAAAGEEEQAPAAAVDKKAALK